MTLHDFYDTHNNSLPRLNDSKMVKEILEISLEIYNNAKNLKQKWVGDIKICEDKIILNLANYAKSEISPIFSFLGDIAAQELIKFTGNYTPINQWFWFEFSEVTENIPENVDKALKNFRYEDNIAIFGGEIQRSLIDSNNFTLMWISNNNDKKSYCDR